jgi:hypothetical protein
VFEEKMSMRTKPSIMFCDGIWADGSGFSNVIPPLQAEGHEVIAAQYGLDTDEGDIVGAGWCEGARIRNQTVRVDL